MWSSLLRTDLQRDLCNLTEHRVEAPVLEVGGLSRGAGVRPLKTMLLTMKSLMKTRTSESRAPVVSWLSQVLPLLVLAIALPETIYSAASRSRNSMEGGGDASRD